MKGLPASIDVEKFVEVRGNCDSILQCTGQSLTRHAGSLIRDQCDGKCDGEREVCIFHTQNLQFMIVFSSGSSGQRVWQTLPRHLRRRAASHDVRRVPLRLRERARAEVNFFFYLFNYSVTCGHSDGPGTQESSGTCDAQKGQGKPHKSDRRSVKEAKLAHTNLTKISRDTDCF